MAVRNVLIAGLLAALLIGVGWAVSAAAALQAHALDPAADRAAVARGSELARLGDCAVCHTAAGGGPYAGGAPIKTPFGVVFSTNITPDETTGIGRWDLGVFRKAMRDGAAPWGRQLYPAFPYDHFARLTNADIDDLYVFLKSRNPVSAKPPPNRLIFPLQFRPVLLGWKLLFLHPSPIAADPRQSAAWNRGQYLVEALGHCGACHTPHGLLGEEERSKAFDGGWSEGWYAPPLNARSPAASAWTVEALDSYLRTGLSLTHAAAAGPMGPVSHELAEAQPADVHAIAVYIASMMGSPSAPAVDRAQAAASAHPVGAMLFAGACATCHAAGAPMMNEGRPNLALGTPLHEADPRDTIQIIVQGLKPPVGRAGPYMPAFGTSFTDSQLADLAAYLRVRYTDAAPWPGDLARQATKARKDGGS